MKTAVVTGGNRGLGRGFVESLTARGYRVFATVRTLNAELKIKFPGLQQVILNVGDSASLESAVAQIKSLTDSVDVILNNAALSRSSSEVGGAAKVCKLGSLSRESLLKIIDVNAVEPILLIQGLLPLLKSNPCYCIQISSARGSLYMDETSNSSANYGYRVSKTALTMMTRAMVDDLPKNVRTFAVHPGLVKTDMNPEGLITPAESAEKILSIMDKWQPSMNGNFLNNDGTQWPR